MIGFCATASLLILSSLPQQPDPRAPGAARTGFRPAEAVLVSGVTPGGRLRLDGLGLGRGGVIPGRRAKTQVARGEICSPGGVRVRAQRQGVKLDFVGGAELLVSPDGRLHLREGSRTMPYLRGLRLLLADGALVTILRGGARQPLRAVDVASDGRSRRIFSSTRQVRNASHSRVFGGETLLALGDGRVLYQVDAAGPLLALRRVLCPKDLRAKFPSRRLVVLGDLLASSMRFLPKHAPRKSVQFPQVSEAAARFAQLAGRVFRGIRPRPGGALGELWFGLPEDYRLKVETSRSGKIMIGLYGAQGRVPGVEWMVGTRFTVHFVRPDGGASGGPRYFLKGIDLRRMLDGLYGFDPGRDDRMRVSQLISGLGGRSLPPIQLRRR